MSEVFGATYASAYDVLYRDKDYAAECDLIEGVFRTFGAGPIQRIADLGCGTGGHAIPLARRGYHVIGVDRSAGMLAQARAKAAQAGVADRTTWQGGDLTSVEVHPPVDAALMMFAVLGYLEDAAQVRSALARAHQSLRPGGLLVFDAWFGPAVEHQRPGSRERVVEQGGERLVRRTESTLDRERQRCAVSFHLARYAGERLVEETSEEHQMRYFFADELERALEGAGFELLRISGFPEVGLAPGPSTWSILVVARRDGAPS